MEQIFQIIIFILSAVVHEYMHGWAAHQLGDDTAEKEGRLTLNPLAHLDLWGSIIMPLLFFLGTGGRMIFGYAKPVPFNPYNLRNQKWGPAMVAAAGPLANFAMALFFGLLIRFIPFNLSFLQMLADIVMINLVLMVINLVPIPPLDGSKILSALLPYRWQMKLLEFERYGFIFVIIFLYIGFQLIIPVIEWLFRVIVG